MLPRIMLAGTSSGVGKTTLSIGLMAAFAGRGLAVQPYKCGPDYIDPGFHTAATGNISRNLDTWLLTDTAIRELYLRSAAGVDISVIEGVMGLYDGYSGLDEKGSSAYLSKVLQTPVILVVNIEKMSRSAAAIVLGYQKLDPGVKLAGVILNRGAGERHFRWAREAVEYHTGLPVVGCLARNTELSLPERHLGLVPTTEEQQLPEFLLKLRTIIEDSLDLEKILAIARSAPDLTMPEKTIFPLGGLEREGNHQNVLPKKYRCRLGIAMDKAFNFYYQDGLDLLAAYGAELVNFSPLEDHEPPRGVDGLYIGGGFPEMFAAELEANYSMKAAIREAVIEGMPIYAECGGLMYMAKELVDFEGRVFQMTGAFPGRTVMTKSLQGMGYYTAEALEDNIILRKGQKMRGHLFHWSRLENLQENCKQVLRLAKKDGSLVRSEGIRVNNMLASYLHLHFCSSPETALNFIENLVSWKKRLG